MTDQPPPPSDKKPRRRAAPRKRAAKRVSRDEGATQVVASSAVPAGDEAHTELAASPEAVAERLDPRPLQDAGDRGDAPATDSPLAQQAPVGVSTDSASAAGAEDSPTRAGAPARAREPADATATHAPPGPAEARPSDGATTSFPRQAELRPGELIRVPLSVRWRDLDAFNHVNNSKYLSYLEEARLRWMLAMPGMGMDDDVAPVVAASNLNYRRPIEWPGDVVIELFVERIGGSSLTIGHRIVDSKDGGTLYCDGNVVMVWIDRNSGRSAALPATVRAACR